MVKLILRTDKAEVIICMDIEQAGTQELPVWWPNPNLWGTAQMIGA